MKSLNTSLADHLVQLRNGKSSFNIIKLMTLVGKSALLHKMKYVIRLWGVPCKANTYGKKEKPCG